MCLTERFSKLNIDIGLTKRPHYTPVHFRFSCMLQNPANAQNSYVNVNSFAKLVFLNVSSCNFLKLSIFYS